jgi:hypothetical protein
VLKEADLVTKFAQLGTYSRALSPGETADFIHDQRETWSPVADQIRLMTQ